MEFEKELLADSDSSCDINASSETGDSMCFESELEEKALKVKLLFLETGAMSESTDPPPLGCR